MNSLAARVTSCILGPLFGFCSIAEGQIVPLSQTQHGQADAILAWTSGFPPATATNSQTLNTFGLLDVPAVANNGGISSVEAEGHAQTEMSVLANGYRLGALGYVSGHSNLAALASGSYASDATLVFNVAQTANITLDLTFINLMAGTMGTGGGSSSIELLGPSGVIISITHTDLSIAQRSESVSLDPGQYTLQVTSSASMTFATGLQDHIFTSVVVVDMIVPAPGVLAMMAIAVTATRRRRR